LVKVHKCKECEQTFLSWKEFDTHVNRHLQKHLDEFTPTPNPKIQEKTPWEAFSNNIPEGMNRELLNVFEKYNFGDKRMTMLCLWRNGYLSCALREHSRELELQTLLGEWLKK
jgi:hypothetical protein